MKTLKRYEVYIYENWTNTVEVTARDEKHALEEARKLCGTTQNQLDFEFYGFSSFGGATEIGECDEDA